MTKRRSAVYAADQPRAARSSRSAKFEDGKAFHRRIVRAVTRRDALHASVLDAQFFPEQGQFVLPPDRGSDAIGGREQSDPGQGEGVEDRGAGRSGPE